MVVDVARVPTRLAAMRSRELRPWAEERFGPLDRVDRYELETDLARVRPARPEAEPGP